MTPFNILVYNIMTPVLPPIKVYGQWERAKRVKDVMEICMKTCHLDVVVLNEVIPRPIHKSIVKDMASIGFLHHTEALSDILTEYGGVLIFSKHPISQQSQSLYGSACIGSDCLSSKGVAYARVSKNGIFYNIFATHLQAWPETNAQMIRETQIKQIRKMIKSLSIPHNEPVFLCGDLNMDLYFDKDFIKHLSHTLSMVVPVIHEDSHNFTFDARTNRLVGSDSLNSYKSKKWPEGCVKEYMSTGYCPCCPNLWLDYTLFSTEHRKPLISSMQSVAVKVEPFEMSFHSEGKVKGMQDVSDHYPVIGRFEFEKVLSTGEKLTKKNIDNYQIDRNPNTQQSVVFIFLIIFAIFLVCGIIYIITFKRMLISKFMDVSPKIVRRV
jgi:phospholipase C